MENEPASSLVMSLDKAFNGTLPLLCERQMAQFFLQRESWWQEKHSTVKQMRCNKKCRSEISAVATPKVVVGAVTRPLPRMGARRKIMEPQKTENSSGPGPELVERQRVAKDQVAQSVRSWTVQNEMRGVNGRVSAGAT